MKSANNKIHPLFRALERAMKPLIRLMLARGITYTQFTDWLKNIYVEIAIQDFSPKDKTITDSRISVLTGVHRKDVRRLRSTTQDNEIDKVPENINLGSKLVSAWLNSPELMENNLPKKIPRLKKFGGSISFEALAETVTKDVRSRALLEELSRLAVVSVDDNDMVSLVTEAFIPAKGEEEKTFYLGLGIGDHANAAVNNVLGCHPSFFDRVVHYNNFTADDIAIIESLSRKEGSKLLQLINAESENISRKTNKSKNAKPKRFSFGVYFYSEDEDVNKNA